jgi:integrase
MVTLTALCAEYLVERRYDLEESTRKTTERACRWFDLARGRKTIDQLTATDGERYKAWLVDTGRSKTSANIYLRAIQPVMEWAARRSLVDANVLREVKPFRVTRKPVRIYEDWQFERLLRYCPDDRWCAILWLARTTGLRRSALLNLTRDNVRDGFVWVEPKRKTQWTWPWEPKDKEIRRVPLVDKARLALANVEHGHYVLLPPGVEKRLLGLQEAGMLREELRKRPMHNFNRTFNRIQFRAFGRRIGDFHMLRKTFTTHMCEVLPEHFVMRLTGHSCSRTLTHYTSARESYYELARKSLSEGLKKEGSTPVAAAANLATGDEPHWAVLDSNQ